MRATRGSLQDTLCIRKIRENKEAILRMDDFMALQRIEIQRAEQKRGAGEAETTAIHSREKDTGETAGKCL